MSFPFASAKSLTDSHLYLFHVMEVFIHSFVLNTCSTSVFLNLFAYLFSLSGSLVQSSSRLSSLAIHSVYKLIDSCS